MRPIVRVGSEGAPVPRLYALAALACVWWCGLAGLSLGLNLMAPNGTLRDSVLPSWVNLTLACTELTILALVLVLAAGLVALLQKFHVLRMSSVLRGLSRGCRWLGVGLLIFTYAASWGLFWFTGHFLDREAFDFLAGDAGAVLGYVQGVHAIALGAVAALAFSASVFTCEFLPRWIRRWRPILLRRFTHGVVALVGLCFTLFLGGELLHAGVLPPGGAPEGRDGPSREEVYRFRRDHGTGPFARLVSDFLGQVEGPKVPPDSKETPHPISRPLLSLEESRASFDDASMRRFNVIVVVVDSLRADHLQAYGGYRKVMPELDELARQSRLFTDCCTTSSHTDYATPSILSSHYPLRSPWAHRYPEHPSYPRVFLYDVLKALGYRTAIFSSQDEGWRQMDRYLETGNLDKFFHAAPDHSIPVSDGPETLPADPGFTRYPEGTLDDAVTLSEAMKWIRTVEEGPFFLYVNLQNAHAPFHVPAHFSRPFGPRDHDIPISFGWFPRDQRQTVRDIYADSLSYVDSQLDRLFRCLEDRQLRDRTVLVVTGDHGEAFYEHGFAAHGGPLYEEVARVPLILWAPGLEPGRDERPAQIIDIPPSILHVLGVPPHPSFQGIDLLGPVPSADRPRFLVAQTPFSYQYAVVREGYKLIYDARLGRYSLYDLTCDPGERCDIFANRPELSGRLQAYLGAWYEAQVEYYGDPARQAVVYPPVFERQGH